MKLFLQSQDVKKSMGPEQALQPEQVTLRLSAADARSLLNAIRTRGRYNAATHNRDGDIEIEIALEGWAENDLEPILIEEELDRR